MGTPKRRIKKLPSIRQCLTNTMLEYDLGPAEMRLLSSVPLRGTQQWEAREQLRERCSKDPNKACLSWGPLPEEYNGTP